MLPRIHRSFPELLRRSFGSSSSSKMFLLSESDVRQALSYEECLKINRQALLSITDKSAFVPSRLGLPYPNNPNLPSDTENTNAGGKAEDWTLIKPAAYYGQDQEIAMGMKVISLRADNPSRGLPLAPATILMVDPPTGLVQAIIAGTHVTVARTSAGPALAVQTFRPDAEHLVLFGAGSQAECHVELMQIALGRNIPRITIINRSLDRAERLQAKWSQEPSFDTPAQQIDVVLLENQDLVAEAISTADVISTTTNSTESLWKDGSLLKPGCLVTAIGGYTPQMQEVPPSAVDRCHVIIDTPEAMTVGDLKHLQETYPSSKHPVTLAGDAFRDPGTIGKTTDCILYKAVGTAIQDVLTAQNVLVRAKELGIGQEIDMD